MILMSVLHCQDVWETRREIFEGTSPMLRPQNITYRHFVSNLFKRSFVKYGINQAAHPRPTFQRILFKNLQPFDHYYKKNAVFAYSDSLRHLIIVDFSTYARISD